MNKHDKIVKSYMKLRDTGSTPSDIFAKAKSSGYKNYECIHILTVVFEMTLNEARKISHEYYYKNKP